MQSYRIEKSIGIVANDDAGVSSNSGGGTGIVVRHEKGRFLVALAKRVVHHASVEQLEALAAYHGMVFAWDLACLDIIIEEDACRVFKVHLITMICLNPGPFTSGKLHGF